MRIAMVGGRIAMMFQSAPVVADGRCRIDQVGNLCRYCFNPRPSLPTGDAPTRRPNMCANTFQSAPVVADGRCTRPPGHHTSTRSFNPRPSLPTGDAWMRSRHTSRATVSIRARRCRRAMPCNTWEELAMAMFQSAPVVADGRCQPMISQGSGIICFNPRPSLPTGDALIHAPITFMAAVSIRARRCRRAMHGDFADGVHARMFQSAPVVADGRCAQSSGSGECQCVSIRARRCRRAMLAGDITHKPQTLVSIRARRCRRAML